ncbi:hypothetical protein EPN44_00255 [bacterium]|nr:MAG: hypothetical protein EPN44_00255 [bacterium]
METHTLHIGESMTLELPQPRDERWKFIVMGSGIQARRGHAASNQIARWEMEGVHAGRVLISAALVGLDGRVTDTRNFLYRVEPIAQPSLVRA